jgi:hypothetical protein
LGDDNEAAVLHCALQKLNILPHEFLAMDKYEQAFVIASISVRVDAEKEELKKIKSATKK